MSVHIRTAVIVLVLVMAVPGLASAACFDLTGLPEAAALDLSPLAPSLRGHAPFVGEALGVCGPGEPPAVVEGAATTEPNGTARVGLKLLAARPGCSGGEAEFVLPPPFTGGTGQVRLPEGSVANVRLTLDASGDACRLGSARPGACVGNATTLCLQQNRFRVVASKPVAGGPAVPGRMLKHSTESGHAAFDPDNVELTVKVLNACAINNRYWVSHGALSNVEYTITVTDTRTGSTKTYTNPAGRLGITATDVAAFVCP